MINVLYLGNNRDGMSPGDRRRFLAFVSLSDNLNIYLDEKSGVKFDVLVCALGCDLIKALRLSDLIPKVVLDYTNHYLVEKSWMKDMFRIPVGSILNKKELSIKGYKKTILEFMGKVDLVLCPSITHKNFLKKIGIESVVLTDFFGKEVDFNDIEFKGRGLFWEGQSSNLTHLKTISSVFKSQPELTTTIVSDQYIGMLGGRYFRKSSVNFCNKFISNLEFYNWSISNVNMAARKSSFGAIPIDLTNDIAISKPENKLVLMWMLGLYTLCSPTESYSMLSKKTGVNFLCNSIDQWNESIDGLLSNEKDRIEKAKYLHDFSRNEYSDAALFLKWKAAFENSNIL
jgi:hypothetical protein